MAPALKVLVGVIPLVHGALSRLPFLLNKTIDLPIGIRVSNSATIDDTRAVADADINVHPINAETRGSGFSKPTPAI
jgi:hypothetical protein